MLAKHRIVQSSKHDGHATSFQMPDTTLHVGVYAEKKFDNVSCSIENILKNYQSFMKSELPQRVFFHQNGKWNSFSEDFVALIQRGFQMKNAVFEAILENQQILLDFLHMICINKETKLSKPIAWIDKNEACFFPIVSASNEQHDKLSNATLETNDSESCVHSVESLNSESPVSEEVVSHIKQSRHTVKCASGPDVIVRDMLLHGLCLVIDRKDIDTVEITTVPHKSNGLVHYDAFRKQIEETHKIRGDANVRYGWMASSKEAVENLMSFGVLKMDKVNQSPLYGVCVHLSPANSSNICASYSDVDENGIIHMVLCRIIMGNVELVCRGSDRYEPSSEIYDSGVDDFSVPKHYIICHKHMHTHIYPEFVAAVKLSSKAKGILAGKKEMSNKPHVTKCDSSDSPILQKQEKKLTYGRAPKSASSGWMPFPMLLDAISSKISAQDTDLIYSHYYEFKRKNMDRDSLLKKLKHIVGDKLLVATIKKLQPKLPKVANRNL